MDFLSKKLRFTIPFPLLAYPIYLVSFNSTIFCVKFQVKKMLCLLILWSILLQWTRSPGKSGSHYDPNSDLFTPNEKKDVITSTACWSAMVASLVGLSFVMGPIQLLKLYGIPYVVSLSNWIILLVITQKDGLVNEYVELVFLLFTQLLFISDLCHVVGLGDLLASPWSWWQAPLVPWWGMLSV